MAVKEKTVTFDGDSFANAAMANGGQPRKKLILNAFVEMCK